MDVPVHADPPVRPPEELSESQAAEAKRQLERTPLQVRESAERMLRSPNLFEHLASDFEGIGIAGERQLATMLYLVGTSRLLPKPLAILVQGPSSSGKSYCVEKTATLFPEEAILRATHMTANALYYLEAGSLEHRYVVAGERSRIQDDDKADTTRALREMLSTGELRKITVQRNERDRHTSESILQKGPIAYAETTTLVKVFEEDANRMILWFFRE